MTVKESHRAQIWRRRGYAAAATLVLHAVLIYGASLVEPRLGALWLSAPDTEVTLIRAPEAYLSLQAKTAKSKPSPTARPPALAPLRPHRVAKIMGDKTQNLLPLPPVPAAPAVAGPAAAAPFADAEGDLRGALRAAIGCAHEDFLSLSAAERARCQWQLASGQAAIPRIDHMSPERRAELEAEAASNERRRLGREGAPAQIIVACSGPGSNFGVGCLPSK